MALEETEEQEAHNLRHLNALQWPGDRVLPPRVGDYRKPVNCQAETTQIAADITVRLRDDRVDERIIWKVASAVAQQRMAPHLLWGVVSTLDHARNRGGYFVAAMKNAFVKSELSWKEEEWQ